MHYSDFTIFIDLENFIPSTVSDLILTDKYSYIFFIFFLYLDENLNNIGYINWSVGEPNNPLERCGAMCINGGLCDVPCSQPSYFFCEKMTN